MGLQRLDTTYAIDNPSLFPYSTAISCPIYINFTGTNDILNNVILPKNFFSLLCAGIAMDLTHVAMTGVEKTRPSLD